MSDIKMWGKEPFWGLGYRVRSAVAADRRAEEAAEDAHRSLPDLDARERGRERQEAHLSAQEFRDPGQARLPRPDRAEGTGRHGREPRRPRRWRSRPSRATAARRPPCATPCIWARSRRRCSAITTIRALKDILSRIDKDCLVGTLSYSDPGDRLAFLVPGLVGRQEGRWRLAGHARRRRGPPRAASPIGISCRPPARISAATTPTSPAS